MEEAPPIETPGLSDEETSVSEAGNKVLLCALSGQKLALDCIDSELLCRPRMMIETEASFLS